MSKTRLGRRGIGQREIALRTLDVFDAGLAPGAYGLKAILALFCVAAMALGSAPVEAGDERGKRYHGVNKQKPQLETRQATTHRSASEGRRIVSQPKLDRRESPRSQYKERSRRYVEKSRSKQHRHAHSNSSRSANSHLHNSHSHGDRSRHIKRHDHARPKDKKHVYKEREKRYVKRHGHSYGAAHRRYHGYYHGPYYRRHTYLGHHHHANRRLDRFHYHGHHGHRHWGYHGHQHPGAYFGASIVLGDFYAYYDYQDDGFERRRRNAGKIYRNGEVYYLSRDGSCHVQEIRNQRKVMVEVHPSYCDYDYEY